MHFDESMTTWEIRGLLSLMTWWIFYDLIIGWINKKSPLTQAFVKSGDVVFFRYKKVPELGIWYFARTENGKNGKFNLKTPLGSRSVRIGDVFPWEYLDLPCVIKVDQVASLSVSPRGNSPRPVIYFKAENLFFEIYKTNLDYELTRVSSLRLKAIVRQALESVLFRIFVFQEGKYFVSADGVVNADDFFRKEIERCLKEEKSPYRIGNKLFLFQITFGN